MGIPLRSFPSDYPLPSPLLHLPSPVQRAYVDPVFAASLPAINLNASPRGVDQWHGW